MKHLSGIAARFEVPVVIALLFLMIGSIAYLNAGFNAELAGCSAWRLHHVYGGLGCAVGVNGEVAHVEGATNLRNLSFFAGGSEPFSLGYEIATNRLLFPFLGSLVLPIMGSLLEAYAALNLICWLVAATCGYMLAKLLSDDVKLAIFTGIFIATGVGFVATWMGLKAHLLSYSYFIVAIYVLERIRFFDAVISRQQLIVAGTVIGLSVFANGLILPLLIYCTILLLAGMHLKRLALLSILAALPILTVKIAFSLAGISTGDRTDTVLLSHFLSHLKMITTYLMDGKSEPINFLHIKVTDPWQPFAWIKEIATKVPMYFGLPGLVLAFIGLMPPWRRLHAVSVASILAICLAVFAVQTYWPFWTFMGYTFYYIYVGFALLIAFGSCRLATWSAYIVETIHPFDATYLRVAVFAGITLIWIGISSQYVVNHHYVTFFKYYNDYSIDFPDDWDFRIGSW